MITENALVQLSIGQTASYTRKIGDADVALYALVTGDENPLHLDQSYADSTPLGQRTVPITLVLGLAEAAFARTIPGICGFIRQQQIETQESVFIDDEITITISILSIDTLNSQIVCSISVARDDSTIVLTGTTVLDIRALPPLPEDTSIQSSSML
jgi:3-hydroxybutyryl-CoA dehydratase